MDITETDRVIVNLARDYARELANAHGSPMQKGSEAQRAWLKRLESNASQRGCKVVATEPSTAVTGPGPGHTGLRRYDALLDVSMCEVWVELQASKHPKGAQLRAQLIGFGEGCAGATRQAIYYRIIGSPREIHRWTREQARGQILTGQMLTPPTVLQY